MALQLPVVASPVGVNSQIIEDGISGFLCNSLEEWIAALGKLIRDSNLRKSMGANGRNRIRKHYSILSNSANFLSLFE
jgi:glycosyltransferase involved in cell wall biosynthesis